MPKRIAVDDLITTVEAASILDKHVRTVHRFVADGTLIPITKIPGKTGAYLFRRFDVERLAKRINTAA